MDRMAGTIEAERAREALAELLRGVGARDQSALAALYQRTSAKLYGICLRVLGSESEAQDVLQEVYVTVWSKASQYDAGRASPMTWLSVMARNKAIDSLRAGKAERASTVALDDDDGSHDVPADAAQQPQQLLDDSLLKGRIADCMGTLHPSQRQALALAYYRGMVHTDIAEALNAPLGTAKAWVRRGLDKLKDCLEAAGVVA